MKAVLLVAACMIFTFAAATTVKKTHTAKNGKIVAVVGCALRNVVYNGTDNVITVDRDLNTIRKCGEGCNADPRCKTWSFAVPTTTPTNSLCVMRDTDEGQTMVRGWVSGEKWCF